MTTRILIRAGKEPWVPISPEASLDGNVLGMNSGNMLFGTAAFSALATPDSELTADYFQIERTRKPAAIARQLADRYDHVVVPLANAFRTGFVPHLDRWSEFLEAWEKPVTIVGVGGQFKLDPSVTAATSTVEASATRFMRAALRNSPSVGVRGEQTARFLQRLGFGDHVQVIGCPSLYRPDLPVDIVKGDSPLGADAKISVSVTPRMASKTNQSQMSGFLKRLLEDFSEIGYIPQENADLEMMLWGTGELWGAGGEAAHAESLPLDLTHPFFAQNRARMFVDVGTWVDYVRDFDFAVGNRIHGNIAALLAGVPAVVLAFDSRLRELSEFHRIPHRTISDDLSSLDVRRLYDEVDYAEFNRTHVENLNGYVRFLEAHGLQHSFGTDGSEFRAKMEGIAFPRPVDTSWLGDTDRSIMSRLAWLRREGNSKKSPDELRHLLPEWSDQQRINKRERDAGWLASELKRSVNSLEAREQSDVRRLVRKVRSRLRGTRAR